jgi:MraZ protein
MMENYFSGEYFNTLDEKGRVAFPARLRSVLGGDVIWVTKGMGNDKSLLLYSPEEWKRTIEDLEKKLSIYQADTRWLYRRFISPAREVVIDKNGRIAIPQNLRDFANLKKDCVFLGMNTIIELWDVETLNTEDEKASESGNNIFEELGKLQNSSLKSSN